MLIDIYLIGDEEENKELIVLSLFGDVIRVQNFGKVYLSKNKNKTTNLNTSNNNKGKIPINNSNNNTKS
jgi:hypothetical protein